MKKRLIIVGNKPFTKDRSSEIDSFDFVVRVNRMNNYGMSGYKIDLLCTDLNQRFFDLVEQPFDKYRNAKSLLLNSQKYSLNNVSKALCLKIFKPKQIVNAIRLNFNKFSLEKIDFYDGSPSTIPTNFFKTLIYILKNFSNEYEVYITGIDIANRYENIKNTVSQQFKNDIDIWHSASLKNEETEILNLLKNKTIKFL